MLDPLASLRRALTLICDDAFFALTTIGPSSLDALAARRSALVIAVARGEVPAPLGLSQGEPWALSLIHALVVDHVPSIVPMRDAVDDGMTLLREVGGVRALLPGGAASARDRARREGLLAVRALRSVCASDGVISVDEAIAVDRLLAAIGLPEDDLVIVSSEAPQPIASLDVEGIDGHLPRLIVEGAWDAAATDGVTPQERDAVLALAARLGIANPDRALAEASEKIDARLAAACRRAAATIDVVRYVVEPSNAEAARAYVDAAIGLVVAPRDRATILASLQTTPLSRALEVDRGHRAEVLAAAWVAALATNPTTTERARLAARHDRAAIELGGSSASVDARVLVDGYVARCLHEVDAALV